MFANLENHPVNPLVPNRCILMHDNARPHVAQNVTNFLQNLVVSVSKQAPYSPDTNLCDLLIFPAMEMKRTHLSLKTHAEVQQYIRDFFQAFIQSGGLRNAKKKLKLSCEKIIEHGGEYSN